MGTDHNECVRISKWAHVFFGGKRGYLALYHALNMGIVFLENKYLNLLEKLRLGTTVTNILASLSHNEGEIESIIDELVGLGIVVLAGIDDNDLLKEKREEHMRPPGLETLYLIVTDNCNLRCRYCFINNGMPEGYRNSNMEFPVAKDAVDMFFYNLSKNPLEYSRFMKTIFFYGGEPFLNFGLIKRVVEYIETSYANELAGLGQMFRMSIVTNGTAVTEEAARFVGARPNLDVAVSIDGPRHIHDKQRIGVDGKGSFDKAISGLVKLKAGGKSAVSVSCTIGADNVDSLPALLELNKEFGFSTINLNPLVDTANFRVGKKYMRKAAQRMVEYFAMARDQGIYEDRVMRKAKAFMNKAIHAYDCQALGAQLVCTPDGQLGVCHEGIGMRQFFFAKVSKIFDFHHHPVIVEWKRRTPLNMPQCYGCSAIGICGGGCAFGARLRNGSIWSVDDRFCIHSLKTLDWLIWDLFASL